MFPTRALHLISSNSVLLLTSVSQPASRGMLWFRRISLGVPLEAVERPQSNFEILKFCREISHIFRKTGKCLRFFPPLQFKLIYVYSRPLEINIPVTSLAGTEQRSPVSIFSLLYTFSRFGVPLNIKHYFRGSTKG